LDFPDLGFQLTNFRTKTGKQLMITSGARSNDPPQVFNLLGLKHGSDSEPAIDVNFIYRRITTDLKLIRLPASYGRASRRFDGSNLPTAASVLHGLPDNLARIDPGTGKCSKPNNQLRIRPAHGSYITPDDGKITDKNR
jgi:hypothetical protein